VKYGLPIATVILIMIAGGMAVCANRYVNGWLNDSRRSFQTQKSYSRLIAEGVHYRDYQMFGVDRMAFKRCVVEKRRSGAITFGAFNVLVVDELSVTFNVRSEKPGKTDADTPETFAHALISAQGLNAARFSGMRINGLIVNRCVSNGVKRVFSAKLAETGQRANEGLRLHACAIVETDGEETQVNDAHLLFRPEPLLVCQMKGGERRIKLGQGPEAK